MSYNPDTHLAIARERQGDFLREARRRELARLATADRPGPLARLRSLLGERRTASRPLARPA
jgi:hypothetical protein